jgi:hypothetical protein
MFEDIEKNVIHRYNIPMTLNKIIYAAGNRELRSNKEVHQWH